MVPCILFDRDSAYIFSTLAVRLVKRELETPCSTLLFAKIFAEKSGQHEHEHCKNEQSPVHQVPGRTMKFISWLRRINYLLYKFLFSMN